MNNSVCYVRGVRRPIFYIKDLKEFKLAPVPLLGLQIASLSLVPRFLHHFLLKPIGQPLFVSQLLVGIFFGQSILGRLTAVKRCLFPPQGELTLDTLALFNSMFFLFKVGVQMDPTIIKKVGKKSYAIGFSSFFLSWAFGIIGIKFLTSINSQWRDDPGDQIDFPKQATSLLIITSISSFPVIACALSDLNILNSKIGRLATSSAMVNDICQLFLRIANIITRLVKINNSRYALYAFLTVSAYILFLVVAVRPAAWFVVKRTPEGQAVKQIHIFLIFTTVLLCGLASEAIGLNAMLGTFLLGLAIPDGPPLGASLVDKLEYLVSMVFMPVQVAIAGRKTDTSQLQLNERDRHLWLAEVTVILICCLGKIVGAIVSSAYFSLPRRDAFLLGLIMNIKGIVEVAILNVWLDSGVIVVRTHTVMIFTLLLVTVIIIPLVRNLYDPSTRYLANRIRTIVHTRRNPSSDFRILVCVHNESDVAPVIRLLEASNPTRNLPLSLVVLQLIELVGRASPLLIAHRPRKTSSSNTTKTERIINAFRRFEQRHHAVVSIEQFSTISPYASMHNDVCAMSLDKMTSLIIFPFNKQGARDDPRRPALNRSMKNLLRNLLRTAACSIGILIGRTDHVSIPITISSDTPYHVAVLFLGGPDDREVLAYALNMTHHRSVFLTVVRFFPESNVQHAKGFSSNESQKLLDDELIDHFRAKTVDRERAEYREAEVKDGSETVWVIRSIKDDFDLMMVGRQRLSEDSIMIAGICEDLSECEELGALGDFLASSDFEYNGSILVVQQQLEELSPNQLS